SVESYPGSIAPRTVPRDDVGIGRSEPAHHIVCSLERDPHAISECRRTRRVRADEIPAQRVAVGSNVDPDAGPAVARDDVAEDERPRRDPELTGDVDREEAEHQAVA